MNEEKFTLRSFMSEYAKAEDGSVIIFCPKCSSLMPLRKNEVDEYECRACEKEIEITVRAVEYE